MRGLEALLVGHQLSIWMCRLDSGDRSFVHDPRHRRCSLAASTSFAFDSQGVQAVTCTEPSVDLVARASKFDGA